MTKANITLKSGMTRSTLFLRNSETSKNFSKLTLFPTLKANKIKQIATTVKRGFTKFISDGDDDIDDLLRQKTNESLDVNEYLRKANVTQLLNDIAAIKGLDSLNMTSKDRLNISVKQSENLPIDGSNLQFNSQIVLCTKNTDTGELRKLCTKLRISDKCNAELMEESEYNINCLFRVLPSSQYVMQNKILNIIEEYNSSEDINVEFENFTSEVESNSTNFEISLGKSVKYEQTFQLYQDSSKRYLAFFSRNVDDIERVYSNKFSGDECYYLGFSEYPGYNTHFKFETVANYQSEIDGYIKRDHYVYLTAFDQVKKHYLHCVKKECILTETNKTPLTFKVIRDGVTQENK